MIREGEGDEQGKRLQYWGLARIAVWVIVEVESEVWRAEEGKEERGCDNDMFIKEQE